MHGYKEEISIKRLLENGVNKLFLCAFERNNSNTNPKSGCLCSFLYFKSTEIGKKNIRCGQHNG